MDASIAGALAHRLAELRDQVEVLSTALEEPTNSGRNVAEELEPLRQAVANLEFVLEAKRPVGLVRMPRPDDANPIDVWLDAHSYGIVEEGHASARHRTIIVAPPSSDLYTTHYGVMVMDPGAISVATFVGIPRPGTLIAAALDGKYPIGSRDLEVSFLCGPDMRALGPVVAAAREIYDNTSVKKLHVGYQAAQRDLSEEGLLEMDRVLTPMLDHAKQDPGRVSVARPRPWAGRNRATDAKIAETMVNSGMPGGARGHMASGPGSIEIPPVLHQPVAMVRSAHRRR